MALQASLDEKTGWTALTFDGLMNVLIAVIGLTAIAAFWLTPLGFPPWMTAQESAVSGLQDVDLFFTAFYTAIALLYVQNVAFFVQGREPIYLTYCLYISAIAVHLILYDRLPEVLGLPTPQPWGFQYGLAAGSVALVFVFRFGRQLLNLPASNPTLDRLIKLGSLSAMAAAVSAALGLRDVYVYLDLGTMVLFGPVLIYAAYGPAKRGDRAALIFLLSFVAQFAGLIWAYLLFLFPERVLPLAPLYSDNIDKAESAVWVASLAIEAFLMSLAAQLLLRQSKAQAAAAETRAEKLEQAVKAAKNHIAAQARAQSIDSDAPGRGAPDLSAALRDVIKANAAEPFVDVTFLVRAMATSKATLQRRLKQETGLSPAAFIRLVRLETARDLLLSRDVRSAGEAAARCGFSSQGHFTRHYKDAFGESPAESLQKGQKTNQ